MKTATQRPAKKQAVDSAAAAQRKLLHWWAATCSAVAAIEKQADVIRRELRNPKSPLAGVVDADQFERVIGAAGELSCCLMSSVPVFPGIAATE